MEEKKIKVVHMLTDMNVGGAGRHLQYLIGASDRDRFDFSVILPEGSAAAPALEAAGATRIIGVPGFDSSFSPGAFGRVFSALGELRPDIAHTHSAMTGRHAAVMRRVPVRIMTKHSSDFPPRAVRTFPLRQLCSVGYSVSLDAAIATDDSAAAALRAGGVPRKKIHIIYNGAPEKKAVSAAEKEAAERLLSRVGGGRLFTVGMFCRLEPEKSVETFLRAAAICLRFTGDIAFVVAGDGSRRKELESLIPRYGLGGNAVFTGFLPDPAPVMSLCRVIVSASTSVETSSLSVIEGMGMGLVPVVSDTGGSRRLVGDCGAVTAPDDPSALAEAILRLLRDPDLVSLLSRKAAERARTRFSAEKTASETEKLYLELLGKEKMASKRANC